MHDMPRILLTRRWPEAVENELRRRYEVTVDADDRKLDPAMLVQAMRDFDVLCPTVSDRIDASVLGVPDKRVRLIANYGAGTDHIDLAAASAAGLPVTNTPDVLTEATAEMAILLMLMVARRASEGERELRAGRWTGWRPTHLVGQSLEGKTLGLVGFGRIGQETARRAVRALGMKIAYYSRSRAAPEIEAETGAHYHGSLDELVTQADVVSLHCSGGAQTHHLIDGAVLARMKPTAILVNTARGTVVEEAALVDALRQGRIWGAGLDVYEREPALEPGLLTLPNIALLPHLGSATDQSRVAMGMRVVANIDRFFTGQDLLDRVN